MLRDRPPGLVHIYELIEAHAKTLGAVEIVTRQRYVLFRSVRIFADLTMMTSCVRLVIHLHRRVADPAFFKIVTGEKMAVSHVAKLTTSERKLAENESKASDRRLLARRAEGHAERVFQSGGDEFNSWSLRELTPPNEVEWNFGEPSLISDRYQ